MAHAYAPGLKVAEDTPLRKERKLPLKGEVMVKAGDRVDADTVVARTFLPGHVEPVNVANRLGIEPKDVPRAMLVKEGDAIEVGAEMAISQGFLGFFKSKVLAPKAGRVESISDKTGQVFLRQPDIPVEVRAYVDGVVDEVLPQEGVVVRSRGTYIQGIFGIGGETTGELVFVCERPDQPIDPARIGAGQQGKVLVGGSFVTMQGIEAARKAGVAGIVVGGIDDADLREFLGYDLGVAITGNEELGLTIVVTEGFGAIAMAAKTFDLLRKREGCRASISGATQIRAGVIRPEVFVPAADVAAAEGGDINELFGMDVGTLVRIIREPWFGTTATVVSLPVELQVVESETKVRVVKVRLPDGQEWTLPRANVEVIGS